MSDSVQSKIPFKIITVWVILLIVCYNFLSPDQQTINPKQSYIVPSKLIDAIVFIAMGQMVEDPMVDYSIASVRRLGKWRGEIYVVTDNPQCFTESVKDFRVKTITVPKAANIIEIKSLKPRLMSLMPAYVSGILYIDVDILVTKNLLSFFQDLGNMVSANRKLSPIVSKRQSVGNLTILDAHEKSDVVSSQQSLELSLFDFGAFPDALGHYVGFCSGCEKWHSGVMWLRRGHGERCLEDWRAILLSGRFDTDQQSLDFAEKNGSCSNALTLPTRHLLFAKDYIGMALTSGHTFIHLTAAGRKEDTDYFYREMVIPRIRQSMHPPLNPRSLDHRKQCLPVSNN